MLHMLKHFFLIRYNFMDNVFNFLRKLWKNPYGFLTDQYMIRLTKMY